MRALSITRPWPELIIQCGKRVENRTWTTNYRGLLLLHAAASWQPAALEYAEQLRTHAKDAAMPAVPSRPGEHPTGIVAVADLIRVCAASTLDHRLRCGCGPWAIPGQYHWHLGNVRRLTTPVPCRGSLGLWRPPPAVVQATIRQPTTTAGV